MKSVKQSIMFGALCAVTLGALAPQASAGQVLTSGSVNIGVNDFAGVFFGGVGLSYTGVGDALTPGCLCECRGACQATASPGPRTLVPRAT